MSFFMENSTRLIQATKIPWDLIIIDEAHHLRWSEDDPGPEWMITETLTQSARAALFLTATPRLYGLESQFGLLNLADSNNYSEFSKFQKDVDKMRQVAALAQKIHDKKITPKVLKDLEALFPDDQGETLAL